VSTETATLTLNGIDYPLRWDLRALFRLQGLPHAPAPETYADPARTVHTMVSFVWAALPDTAAKSYPTPESVAAALGGATSGFAAVAAAFNVMMQQAEPTEEKKSEPS